MLAWQSDFARRVWLFKWAIRLSCWSITELFTAPGSSQGQRTNHSPSPSESSQHLGLINPQELICVFSAVTHSCLLHPLRSPSNWDIYEPRHESSGWKTQNKRLFSFFFFCSHYWTPLLLYLHLRSRPKQPGCPQSAPCFRLRTPQCALLNACRLFPTSPFTGSGVVDGPCCRPLHLAALIGREKFLPSTASTRPRSSVCSPGYGLWTIN